jgi:hypothetical protein
VAELILPSKFVLTMLLRDGRESHENAESHGSVTKSEGEKGKLPLDTVYFFLINCLQLD